ncbi:MAG: adenine-specific methyltransferase EcoRI family protein [Candidatus Onthovivens sp.]|nr:adenine-specific methyltransferase EcoRI family protein [Candidatus Onthovivens sp.]
MAKNNNLRSANANKNDEFYTMLTDIEKEMRYYKDFFKGKVVYCNCDDARESNFFKYFSLNFEFLGLKKLITTGYKADGKGVVLVYEGDKNGNRRVDNEEIVVNELNGDGDFRSEECIEYLKECDVVVTNPPFSLFRQYVKQLMDYNKKFIIIGNNNALTYKDIFQLIKDNKIWLGINSNKTMEFSMPMSYEKWDRIEGNRKYGKVPAISWFTNIENKKRTQPIDLYKRYSFEDYPKYDNFDAINVDKVADIPMDYDGIMGVPITFLNNYCPSQFTIIDGCNRYLILDSFNINEKVRNEHGHCCNINGNPKYFRVLIKKVF